MKLTQHLLFLFVAAICWEYCCASCVVETNAGAVTGTHLVSRGGKKYLGFLGIPYAEPPVGKLRFSSPVPKGRWKGLLKAVESGNECIQVQNGKVQGSEDCLYLDVYTPKLKPKTLLPVIVQIIGGAYLEGNASIVTTGPGYLLDKEVVFVSFNYRLGIFGFLSSGDVAAPGNFGLKDQVLALEWVRLNIHKFGGNPNDVTISGEGAGADCIGLLSLSDRAKHLFKRYSVVSGGALNPQAFTSDKSYYEKAKKVAHKFGCDKSDSSKTIECLRGVEASKLVEVTDVFSEIEIALSIEWRPTIEPLGVIDAILTDSPANLIRKDKLKLCPALTGIEKDVGAAFALVLHENEKLFKKLKDDHKYGIESMLQLYEPLRGKDLKELELKIYNYYLNITVPQGKDPDLYRYMLFVEDLFYFYPQQQYLNYLQTKIIAEAVYVYSFDYRGALSFAIPLDKVLGNDLVCLGDELFYIFTRASQLIGPQYNIERTKKDYEIVDLLIDLFSSFVVSGKPSSPRLGGNVTWEALSTDLYLQIGNIFETTSVEVKIEEGAVWERLRFWDENVPRYDLGEGGDVC